MPSKHNIAFYIHHNNTCPVQDYLFDGGDETKVNIIINAMEYLAMVGDTLFDTNMAKKFYDHEPICELIKDRHRIFFAKDKPLNRYVILAAFVKKTQKTPPDELAQAEKYWAEYVKFKKVQKFDITHNYD
jgi:phage-related protein